MSAADGGDANSLVADKSFGERVLDHLYIAGPIILSFVCRKSVDVISVVAVGHLGPHYLASAGLASVTANVTGNSMVMGLSGALSTLCSQANGANDKKELCLVLQRSLLITSTCVCVPVTVLWAFSKPIMLALAQSEAISAASHQYLLCLVPGLWAFSASACMQQWLFAQGNTRPIAAITVVLALLHPLWIYLFIYRLQIGFLGAAMAVSTTKVLELALVLLYANVFSTAMTDSGWQGWSWCSFEKWGDFLSLGLPSLMMMSEWWASEAIIFMSGSLAHPELQVSAMSIYQNMMSLAFMLPAGFREAGSVLVGNALGAGKASAAQASSYIAPAMALLGSSCVSLLLYMLKDTLGLMFTGDVQVAHLVSKLVPLMCGYVVADGVQTALSGCIKGMGRQKLGGPIVLFSYYAVGIPLAAYLGMGNLRGGKPKWGPGWGVAGLCVGTLVATIVHMLCFTVVVYALTNWEEQVSIAQARRAPKDKDTHDKDTTDKDALSEDPDPEDEEGWWNEVNFFSTGERDRLAGRTALKTRSSQGAFGSLQAAWGALRLTVAGWLSGGGSTISDYELVRTYTDSLSPLHLDEDVDDIDFAFI